jgi:hypothetical protein
MTVTIVADARDPRITPNITSFFLPSSIIRLLETLEI